MAYKALYRKYRPETFENVVGQKHIIKTLLNAIEKGSIMSSYFDYNEPNKITNDRYYVIDDSKGNIVLMKMSSDSKEIIIKSKIGEVDYDEGIINLTSFTPIDYIGDKIFSIYATPTIKNIKTLRNNILSIDNINVTGEVDVSTI